MNSKPVRILLIEDSEPDAFLISRMLVENGNSGSFELVHAWRLEEGLSRMKKEPFDAVLSDLTLPDSYGLETVKKLKGSFPGLPILVLTGLADEAMAARAVREGAQDYLVKGQIDSSILVRAIRFAMERRQAALEALGRTQSPGGDRDDDLSSLVMVGESPALNEVKGLVGVIAKTSTTSVLIQGETGTGKGLVANAIHLLSNRRTCPIIKLNCSAIPDTLLETEMFGYEKGAFTDAKQTKKGLFELADGGTIFLDEIGDMDVRLQPKLLQFLESRSFRKIGGVRDIKVDLRVIAATNRDLDEMVRGKRFREDLYYRLKVMVIKIPPLRERREDIIPLAEHFIMENNKTYGKVKRLSGESRGLLLGYNWPGNIRELKNVLERAIIIANSEEIRPENLPIEIVGGNPPHRECCPMPSYSVEMSLEELEKAHIRNVLMKVAGNKTHASRILGISRLTLREKIKKYGIKDGQDNGSPSE